MKINEYNQMMAYITRPSKSTEGSKLKELASQRQLEKYAVQPDSRGAWKNFVAQNKAKEVAALKQKKLDTNLNSNAIDALNKFEDFPILKNNINAKPKKNNVITTYANGGATKKKQPSNEKNKIIIAMSETPSEEYELQLGAEIEQFQKWLKENKDGTYDEFLKDKTAMLTDEQKKDPKIIDLAPYLPNFEEIIKEYEKEQEEKKETLEQFINRRSKEMRLAENDKSGIARILNLKI